MVVHMCIDNTRIYQPLNVWFLLDFVVPQVFGLYLTIKVTLKLE